MLPEIKLAAAGDGPPIVLLAVSMKMPSSAFPRLIVPVGSVPMKLPAIVVPFAPFAVSMPAA